ncbi:hypothetical protein GCM10010169_63830 [Micromonospora fulviviridis]|uniref:hypothetical protein n=1 Tax=Micromonospora fulviviridis TaxID=47860 RepID=UPI001664E203|nr:hypothetical protein [Micromonospora fulviviridis]GGS10281.1 hypothetical protein GCM10010169_63830 [Micromonospora fulviviridis]
MTHASKFAFLPNLHETTSDANFRTALGPAGFLLSPAYATGPKRALAGQLAAFGLEVLADNGNFTLMATAFDRHSARVQTTLDAITNRIGLPLTDLDPGALTSDEAEQLEKLATDLRTEVLGLLPTPEERLASQLRMSATDVIGAEDPTMALWMRADLEPNLLPFTRTYYRSLNHRVCQEAIREIATIPNALQGRYYTVLSANSYDTACDAGREAANAGVENIAVGFGAYMADRNYVGRVRVNGRWRALEARSAAKYLRTLLVAHGIQRGYAEVAGHAPARLHCLGLGAPVMVALVAVLSADCEQVTFDATSPILDAANGTLYTEKDAYLKIRTKAVVDTLLSDGRRSWTCPCPFCADFLDQTPLACGADRARLGRGPATTADLRPGGRLYHAMLLFAEPTRQPDRGRVSRARSGHNHWVLAKVCKQASAAYRARALDAFAADVIQDYLRHSNATPAAQAVDLGWRLLRRL